MTKLQTTEDAKIGGRRITEVIGPQTPNIPNVDVFATIHPEIPVVGKVNEGSFKEPKTR